MLTPVPMVRVELLTLDRDLAAVSQRLGALGVLHPVDVGVLGHWAEDLDWAEMDQLAAEYASTARRADRVAHFLGVADRLSASPGAVSPVETLRRVGGLLDVVEPETRRVEERIRGLEADLQRLRVVEGQLELLADVGMDLAALRALRFLYMVSGLIPRENVERLDDSLEATPHALLPVRQVGSRVLLFAIVQRRDAELLDRALQSAYLERVEIPADLTGTPRQALDQLEDRQAELDRRLRSEEQERSALRDRWDREIAGARADLEVNARVVRLWQQAGRTERMRLLVGWVPRESRERFAAEVATVTGNRSVLAVEEPAPSDPAPGAAPTALSNPAPLRPFEGLTRTYGLPDYWDLDPTPLAALLFLLMFGAMFGDVGQGAALAALGLALAGGRIVAGQRDLGRVLVGCGISAMVFGLLYGSVFGYEELIPALWFRPLDNPLLLVAVAVAFGIVVISIGLVLGLASAWRRRDPASLFLGQSGMLGLWLYWGLVVVAMLAVIEPGRLSPWMLVLLVGAPLLLFLLRRPIADSLGWIEAEEGASAIQAGVEAFDLVIRFTSNTISFLRVGAFALAHIGLGLTVFVLAELVRSLPLASVAILVLGNVITIALEGLIVGIQALRLEYYEFFTKFLRGGGVAYRPFALGRQGTESPRSQRRD